MKRGVQTFGCIYVVIVSDKTVMDSAANKRKILLALPLIPVPIVALVSSRGSGRGFARFSTAAYTAMNGRR